jgi:Flp pilus assembly protein TadD
LIVAEINPQNVDNLKQVGKTYILLGKYKEALEVFDEASQKKKDADWELLHNKAMCFLNLGEDKLVLLLLY